MSLREKKRVQTTEAIVTSALRLFVAQGYDATSVDAIAEAAGVSRRTVFRYFDTKEHIFFARQRARLGAMQALLADPVSGEGRFDTVRRAFLTLAARYQAERARLQVEQRIIAGSRTLAAAELLVLDAHWEHTIVEHLAPPATASEAERRHGVLLGGALAGMSRAVLQHWYATDCQTDLVQLAEQGLRLLEAAQESP